MSENVGHSYCFSEFVSVEQTVPLFGTEMGANGIFGRPLNSEK